MSGRPISRAMLLALLLNGAAVGVAHAGWSRVDGKCVEHWDAGHLVRGPRAIINGVLLPVRSAIGGLFFAVDTCGRKWSCVPMAPLWLVGSTLWGAGEGVYWATAGVLDTPTLSGLRLAPARSTEFRLHPTVPFLHQDPPERLERRCA